MSAPSIIAAVTHELANRVRHAAQAAIPGADVLTTHPDSKPLHQPRVRLFLYRATPNTALANDDLPTRRGDGAVVARPTVALDLHYLLAFYGDEHQLEPQKMLGAVVRELHSRPMLPKSSLSDAVERVRFTPQNLSLDEMSKLWSVFFQAPYALSVAYQCSVVAIDGEEEPAPALPVLSRGQDDSGVQALPDITSPFPLLAGLYIGETADPGLQPRPPSYPSAQLGHRLLLSGQSLAGDIVQAEFSHTVLNLGKTLNIGTADRSAAEVGVTLPNDAAAQSEWAAGLYSVAVKRSLGGETHDSNRLSFALAPRITGLLVASIPGKATLTLTATPNVRLSQNASLLLADRGVVAQARAADSDPLVFEIDDPPNVKQASVRLRVDGVDSLPYLRVYTPPPVHLAFDPQQQVDLP